MYMHRAPTRVAFVAAGRVSSTEAYIGLAESYAGLLASQMQPTQPGEEERRAFETQIFTEVEPALEFLSVQTGGTRTLVLLSDMFLARADEIAAKYPGIQVMVFTGASWPRGKVQVVRKQWINVLNLGDIVS
jgi:hypothetical protein